MTAFPAFPAFRERRGGGPVRAAAALLAVVLFAAGCSFKLPGAGVPSRMYVLTPKSTFPPDLPTVDWQLLIETPRAAAGLNTVRIVLRDSPIEMRYFERANWTDIAPKMIQTLLIESFENSGHIVAVGREAIGLRADYILKTELREFQAEYPAPLPRTGEGVDIDSPPPLIRVRVNAKLIRMPRRAIVASRTFEHTTKVAVNTMGAIIDGFDVALGKIMKRLVEWSLTNGQKYAEEARDKPESRAGRFGRTRRR